MSSSKKKPRDIQPGEQFHTEGHWWTLVGHSHREDHGDIQHWWVIATNELGHRHIFRLCDSDDARPSYPVRPLQDHSSIANRVTRPAVTALNCYTDATHTAWADVHGADPIPVGPDGRKFTPERVVVKYHWRTQLGHQEWHPRAIELSGRWIKPEGERETPAGSGSVLLPCTAAPAWAQGFLLANEPTTKLVPRTSPDADPEQHQ